MKHTLKRFARLTALLCLTALLLLTVGGCAYNGYKGDFPAAYTLVYTQVPDIVGGWAYFSWFKDPQILLLDTDSQGRGLYLYLENTLGPLSLVVVQKSSETEVFFYPEEAAICFRTPDSIYDWKERYLSEDQLMSLYQSVCSEEALQVFLEANDWELPINEEKLDRAEICLPKITYRWTFRNDSVNLEKSEWNKTIRAVAEENGHPISESSQGGEDLYPEAMWMATDAYGRRLYYVEAYYYVYSEQGEYPRYSAKYYLEMLAVLNPDGSYDADRFMIELSDKLHFQDQMRELKKANGWNQPLDWEVES